jgi:hypothetical protein
LNGFIQDVGFDDATDLSGDVTDFRCRVLIVNVLNVFLALLIVHGDVEIVKIKTQDFGEIVKSRKLHFLSLCDHKLSPQIIGIFNQGFIGERGNLGKQREGQETRFYGSGLPKWLK